MVMASMLRALLGLLLGALLLAVARIDAYRIFGSDDVGRSLFVHTSVASSVRWLIRTYLPSP
jgi:hypothetical protein